MTVEDLKDLRERRPFNPFTIHLSDGRSFDVPTPDYLAPHPGGRMAFVWHVVGRGHSFIAIDAITHVSHADAPLTAAPGS
jgi:hypothetical protein